MDDARARVRFFERGDGVESEGHFAGEAVVVDENGVHIIGEIVADVVAAVIQEAGDLEQPLVRAAPRAEDGPRADGDARDGRHGRPHAAEAGVAEELGERIHRSWLSTECTEVTERIFVSAKGAKEGERDEEF